MSMRKDVYERMRYFVSEKIKPNYSAIARQYDVEPRTVKATYLRAQSDTPISNHTKNNGAKINRPFPTISFRY